jgi:4-amino-4-deoxy-L-arabinose transferase-like glycosyltransferase
MRTGGAALALGLFAAFQTFLFFARRDHFAVLLWWTKESWLLVTLLWLKDLVLAAVAFVAFRSLVVATANSPEPAEPDDSGSRLRHALLLLGILAAGVALRWVAPAQVPPGVWGDALYEAEAALREPGQIPWYGGVPFAIEGGGTALVSYLYVKFCELLFQIFGRGDVGLLALSAVGGSLALPAVYWLGRETGGRRVALVAMTLLAFAMSPLVFARWAYTAALLVPLALAAAAATLRALATGRIGWAILAGALLGLSLHTYVPAWAIAASFVVFGLTTVRRPGGWKLLLAAIIAAVIAFLPFALAFLEFPDRLGGRARDVSFLVPNRNVALAGGSGPFAILLRLFHNVVEYSGTLLWTGDPNPRNGIPGRPTLTVLIGVAALVGVVFSWWRARAGNPGHRLLLLVAGASLLAAVLSNPADAPNGLRILPLVGVLTLLAAECLVRWVPASARTLSVRPGFLWALGFSILLVLETVPFFTLWPDNSLVAASFSPVESEAGRTARTLGAAPVIVGPGVLPRPLVFETLAAGSDPNRPVRRLASRTAEDLVANPPGQAFWYVAGRSDLDRLCAGPFRCARGVAVGHPPDDDPVIARVVPVAFAGSGPAPPRAAGASRRFSGRASDSEAADGR